MKYAVAILLSVTLALAVATEQPTQATLPVASQPTKQNFVIQEAGGVIFLLNKHTGDTWKWFHTRDHNQNTKDMGWQYFDLPKKFEACSMSVEGCREEKYEKHTQIK